MDLKSWRSFAARREHRLLMLSGVCVVVIAACSGSGDNTPSADATMTATASVSTTAAPSVSPTATAGAITTATTQVCADAAALKESADNLEQLEPREVGKSGVQAALQDVRMRLDAVKVSAGGQWGGQISEVDAALSALEETVAAVGRGSLLRQLPTIVSQAEQLEQAWSSLEREIDQTCPAS
jgi:hypothetical protein